MKSLLFSIVFFSRVLVVFSCYVSRIDPVAFSPTPNSDNSGNNVNFLWTQQGCLGQSGFLLHVLVFLFFIYKKKTSNSTLTFLVLLNFDCVIKGMRDLFFTRIYSTDKGFSCHLEALNSFLWLLFNLSVFFLNSSYFIVMGKKISSISNVFQISYHR